MSRTGWQPFHGQWQSHLLPIRENRLTARAQWHKLAVIIHSSSGGHMTDRERITEAAESNGWRPQGLPSMMSFRRNGHVVTVQFNGDGKALVARVQGREVRRSVLAAVLQEMRS